VPPIYGLGRHELIYSFGNLLVAITAHWNGFADVCLALDLSTTTTAKILESYRRGFDNVGG
jgi:hypothetical protein